MAQNVMEPDVKFVLERVSASALSYFFVVYRSLPPLVSRSSHG